MRDLIPWLLATAVLSGCASFSQEERRKDTKFIMDTPIGQVRGRVVSEEHADVTTKTGPDTERIEDTFGKVADLAGIFGPWAGAAGLGLAYFLKNRKHGEAANAAKEARDEADHAKETVTRMSSAIEKFKEKAPEGVWPVLASAMSTELDKSHKQLIREVKP